MRKIRGESDIAELRAAIAARGSGWVLFERGERVAGMGDEAVRLEGDVVRAEGRMWRAVGWEERRGELRIAVRGPLGRVASTLRIARDGEGPLAWGSEWFEEALARAVERHWGPDFSISRAGDRYLGSVHAPSGRATVVGVAPGADERAADDALAAGLVARWRRERASGRPSPLLVLSATPALGVLAERLVWMRKDAGIRLFEVTAAEEVRPHDQGGLLDGSRALWPSPSPPERPLVARMLAVAPELRRDRRPGSPVDRVLLRGVEVARVRGAWATFGLGARREQISDESWPRFVSLVAEAAHYRSGEAPDRAHPLYRAYPERWLASLVRDDVRVVDPLLDPSAVYEQVPARRGDSRDYVDLLAVTRSGRLAVVELKASVHRALPLQGLNYWSRVRWHHARGEIARRGYFPGVALDPRPPLLFLVAPALAMHPSVRVVLEWLSPEIDVTVVGLTTDWRRDLRAVYRQNRSR
jgi:hypothetical protein